MEAIKFNFLDLDEKLNRVENYGDLTFSRDFGGYQISLYAYEGMWVEVSYSAKEGKVVDIEPILNETAEILYADYVKISY